MSCFIAPLVAAVATTAIRKARTKAVKAPGSSPFLHHLPDLEKMLWGGTLMLIVDHVINGELTWAFPFFTALGESGGASLLLREILTVGVPMALILIAAWAVWAVAKDRKVSKQLNN